MFGARPLLLTEDESYLLFQPISVLSSLQGHDVGESFARTKLGRLREPR
jgi:hypothetical protein